MHTRRHRSYERNLEQIRIQDVDCALYTFNGSWHGSILDDTNLLLFDESNDRKRLKDRCQKKNFMLLGRSLRREILDTNLVPRATGRSGKPLPISKGKYSLGKRLEFPLG